MKIKRFEFEKTANTLIIKKIGGLHVLKINSKPEIIDKVYVYVDDIGNLNIEVNDCHLLQVAYP